MDNASLDAILSGAEDVGEDYYSILGCDELSSTEQILAEFKCQALKCHPDKHPSDASAAEHFKKLLRAKEVLTDSETRGRYDKWHRSGLAIPFEQWNALSSSVQTSMHWATRNKKEPMLEDAGTNATGGRVADEALGARSKEDAAREGDSPDGSLPKSPTSPGSQEASYWRNSFSWSSDAPSELLRKFRNYEI
ncbi:dnaJ homolog subfamily C member 12 isoform X2 [Petromyzon marinus]|uniref:DnaJ homolog subfamily C member 12 isoform X2 n=1 Tax=Petromyzon marinus TaxID=7757 RepID=A0AAJ7SU33_PETMA|nr:dnaJ homolog subfamily C member 12 isoform X2 [Petromyzon marinus]